jgi:hypothetical protein
MPSDATKDPTTAEPPNAWCGLFFILCRTLILFDKKGDTMSKPTLFMLSLLLGMAACDQQAIAPVDVSTENQPSFASKPVGPVTINTVIDFTVFPFGGTFTVTEGSELLGCSAGTFVDIPAGGFSRGAIRKHFTCTTGVNAGSSFTVNFRPTRPAEGGATGQWQVLNGTGAFANLRGQGDFSVVFSPTEPVGFETLTGAIHFDP